METVDNEIEIGKIIINAVNVHQGGGAVLLSALLKSISLRSVIVFIDSRMQLSDDVESNLNIIRIRPSILSRLIAERKIAKLMRSNDTLLCFGNLPPLFKIAGKVIVFIQNRYLIDLVPLNFLTNRVATRIWIERYWLTCRAGLVDSFIVQTPTMKKLLDRCLADAQLRPNVKFDIYPFVADLSQFSNRKSNLDVISKYDFVYVASGDAHKNHRRLIKAFVALAEEGYRPSLCLTVDCDAYPELFNWIENQKQIHQLNIINLGHVSERHVREIYSVSRALIYPSLLESFGLPLLEAKEAGLPILAGELDYVRDIIIPYDVFDPSSVVSIARAVSRFMQFPQPILSISTASDFLLKITNLDKR